MKRLFALLKVEWIFTFRDAISLGLAIGMPVAFYLIFSGINVGMVPGAAAVMLVSMTLSSLVSFNVFTLPFNMYTDRKNNWLNYIQHSPITKKAYFVVKAIRMATYYLTSILIVFSIGHFVRGVNMPISDWGMIVVIMLLGSIPFALLGILIGFIKSEQTITLIGNIAYMTLSLIGGLWMPLAFFPSWLQSIGKLLPSQMLLQVMTKFLSDHQWDYHALMGLLCYTVVIIVLIVGAQRLTETK